MRLSRRNNFLQSVSVMTHVASLTIGVDIGGTFTDLVIAREGTTITAKAPTTPEDLAGGVMEVIGQAAQQIGCSLAELLEQTSLVKHGSTVATNALITRRGARVGLITTRGFEDTPLIMRAVGRVDGLPEEEVRHVAAVAKPEPLVTPELIRGVRERVSASGAVIVPLNHDDVQRAAGELIDDNGIEALAISLLHAWVNPVHERAVRDFIEERYADRVYLSIGGELSQVAGEYARTNTAIANAFVGPIVDGYLMDLETRLGDAGFRGRLLVMQGNGGLAGRAQATPISTLQSGPAGGMLAAAYVGAELHDEHVITTDMGGTSFDVGLIDGGYWRYAEEPIFERFRIQQPIIRIESIGAGGGTIARVDPTVGRLLVGPQSAGARPGPVCYGMGGTEPTVTDCDLILGYLDPEYFLGGHRRLALDAARTAVEEHLARPLGMAVDEVAAGVIAVVNSKMSDLIRREVVRSGHLPEDYVLYAFGGAGPLHAVGYARDLGIRTIRIFPTSAVFSAFGIALADLVHTRLATRTHGLPTDPDALNSDLHALEQSLSGEINREALSEDPRFRRYLTMRFRRQTTGEEIALPWERFTPNRVAALADIFVRRYEELYGVGTAYRDAGMDVSAIRVDAIGPVAKPELARDPGRSSPHPPRPKRERPAYFDGGWHLTPVYEYDHLTSGSALDGPAIVESPFTTIVLPPASNMQVDDYRNLVIAP